MPMFALVHGAWHGAWCWQSLESELVTLGHEVVTVDLPCDDPNATFSTYADVVATALHNVPDVVLVGHSLAGLTIPLVASRRPVRHLVFLCALIPEPSRSLVDQMEAEPEMLNPNLGANTEIDELGRSQWIDPIAARGCDREHPRTARMGWGSGGFGRAIGGNLPPRYRRFGAAMGALRRPMSPVRVAPRIRP